MFALSKKMMLGGLLLPFLLFFVLFEILPFMSVIKNSFYDTLNDAWNFANYRYILDSKLDKRAITTSLTLSAWSTVWGLLLAFLATFSITSLHNSRLKNALLAFTTMSNNFSGVPLAFAFIILLGANGCLTLILRHLGFDPINIKSSLGILFIYIYFQIPLGILLLFPALSSLKKEWREANDLLGGSHFTYWKSIALPILIKPIMGSTIILFANAIGAYATIYALAGTNYLVVPTRIASLINGNVFYDPYGASALAVILMLILCFISLINYLFFRNQYKY